MTNELPEDIQPGSFSGGEEIEDSKTEKPKVEQQILVVEPELQKTKFRDQTLEVTPISPITEGINTDETDVVARYEADAKKIYELGEQLGLQPKSKQEKKTVIQELRDRVIIKESAGGDSTQEKIALIEGLYDIDYTDEEKKAFDDWLARVPESSAEKPIIINNVEEVARFLPQNGNYRGEKINLFFKKEAFLPDELQAILEMFSQDNPSFEISVVRHGNNLISVGIGDKARNGSTILDGENFGHYHPTQFKLENEEVLPSCFTMGLMPSAGDVKGFLKHFESVKEGTRIFSKNGYVFIKPALETENIDQVLGEFSQKYFDLFLGLNKLGLKSDEEVVNYFKENFGFDIELHYFIQRKT